MHGVRPARAREKEMKKNGARIGMERKKKRKRKGNDRKRRWMKMDRKTTTARAWRAPGVPGVRPACARRVPGAPGPFFFMSFSFPYSFPFLILVLSCPFLVFSFFLSFHILSPFFFISGSFPYPLPCHFSPGARRAHTGNHPFPVLFYFIFLSLSFSFSFSFCFPFQSFPRSFSFPFPFLILFLSFFLFVFRRVRRRPARAWRTPCISFSVSFRSFPGTRRKTKRKKKGKG